jgi:hypothetical protein
MKRFFTILALLFFSYSGNITAAPLSDSEKTFIKSQLEQTAKHVSEAVEHKDYEKYMSLIIPANPTNSMTKQNFLKCISDNSFCKKQLLSLSNIPDKFGFVDLRQDGEYTLYYFGGLDVVKEQGKEFNWLYVSVRAFKKDAAGWKMLGKACGNSSDAKTNKITNAQILTAIEKSACLSNPVLHWKNEKK